MSKIEKQSAALTVLTANPIIASQRSAMIENAKAQFDTLVNHRRQAPYRAIALGLTLHQLKAGCKHGEWMPLYGQILKSLKFVTEGTAKVYASQYMRLALTFLTEADAARAEFISLTGNKAELSLHASNATERELAGKMAKFIGERSLDELLTDYDLRNAAETKRRKLAASEGDANPAEQEKTAQDLFNEYDQSFQQAGKGATEKCVWMQWSKQHHDDLLASARSAYERISAAYSRTHGRARK